jgi:hypothetical protein
MPAVALPETRYPWSGDSSIDQIVGDQVLAPSTINDHVAGSAVELAERGVAELKRIPGEWRLYAVVAAPA